MQQIIFFFIRNKNFLLFLLLFSISIGLTINSRSYHQSKFVTSANFISGGIYSWKSNITDYFDLRTQNELLTEENNRLRTLLKNARPKIDSSIMATSGAGLYDIYTATVINNNYSNTKNYLTLNRGKKDSIQVDMGVISPKGVVGIVHSTSKNYAAVQSVLNSNSQIVAKFKKSDHFGTLIWNGQEPTAVQLTEIPRIAPVALGDTIVTDGKSTIFPEGILIGKVKDFERDPEDDYYKINIELFTDMTSLKHVYVVKHNRKKEIQTLEQQTEDAQ